MNGKHYPPIVLQSHRVFAYVESLIFVLAAVVLNVWRCSDAPGYYGWPITPYHIVILLIAGRYGLVPGLFCSVTSALAQAITICQMTTGAEAAQFLEPSHLWYPVSLVIMGVMVGGFSETWLSYLRRAISERDQALDRFGRIMELHDQLAEEKHMLDKQILSEEETFESLAALFQDLDRLDPRQIRHRALRLARKLVGGGSSALYVVNASEDSSGREVRRFLGNRAKWPESLPIDHPVIERSLVSSDPVAITSVRGWMSLEQPVLEPVQMACRVLSRKSGRHLVLAMKGLPLVAFSPSRKRALYVIMKITRRALKRATLFRRIQDRNVEDPITTASSFAYFSKRVKEELFLAKRHHQKSFAIIKIRAPKLEKTLRRRELLSLRRALAKTFKECLRIGDLVALGQMSSSFLILCPFTSVEDGETVVRRIRDRLRELGTLSLDRKGTLQFAVLNVDPKTASYEDLMGLVVSDIEDHGHNVSSKILPPRGSMIPDSRRPPIPSAAPSGRDPRTGRSTGRFAAQSRGARSSGETRGRRAVPLSAPRGPVSDGPVPPAVPSTAPRRESSDRREGSERGDGSERRDNLERRDSSDFGSRSSVRGRGSRPPQSWKPKPKDHHG